MPISFQKIDRQFTQMAQIHSQSFVKSWSETTFRDMFADSPQYSGWLICQDDQVAGFIICSQIVDEAEIITICISPSFQKQGFGAQLLNHQLDIFKQVQVKKLFLEVNEKNHAAIALYKKLGFEQTAMRKNYYKLADGTQANALIFTWFLPWIWLLHWFVIYNHYKLTFWPIRLYVAAIAYYTYYSDSTGR